MASSSPALTSRVALVTGVTGSIGKSIARLLASSPTNYSLILPVRDVRRGEKIATEIKQSTGNEHVYVEYVDLSSKASISKLTSLIQQKYKQLHVLVNNAAIVPPTREETADGLEMQFAVNVYAYYLLSRELRPLLRASSRPNQLSRIVNVASLYAGQFDVTDLQFKRRRYDSNSAYMQSKAANRLLTAKLAQLYANDGITVNAAHPGVVTSNVLTGLGFGRGGDSPDAGAATPVLLASSEKLEGITGKWFVRGKVANCEFIKDQPTVDKLWELLEKLSQLPPHSQTTIPRQERATISV